MAPTLVELPPEEKELVVVVVAAEAAVVAEPVDNAVPVAVVESGCMQLSMLK